MKIVITGSLGNISKPLAEELIQKGHLVTVISSNPDKQKDIEALGAKAAIGKLEDIGFLTAAFSGADAVYAMIPPDFAAPDLIARYQTIGGCYAQAIEQSGVKKVVQLSSWGAHLPEGTGVITGSYHVEQIFNQLKNVDITYLRPTSFYYNLFHYIDMIKTAGFIGTNFGGNDKVAMVSPVDIAAAAAEELEISTTGRKIRYIASDDRTCNEVAAVLGAAIGKPDLQWKLFTDEQTGIALESNGISPYIANLLVELNTAIHSGAMREDYDQHQPVMGKVKLEDFAKEFAAVYHQK
ncbi:NAD(P)H-binding protein [Pedobacter nototheniae]|uniref:NAD(P)H-binding protein n=1 Tax=Pedobacter nototheniae TaxID=2488994 RepID=UPI002930F4DC|nr:NAD(P)H-binding protein [Pedobacter nototheniae]